LLCLILTSYFGHSNLIIGGGKSFNFEIAAIIILSFTLDMQDLFWN
jgi:hypothetical protein